MTIRERKSIIKMDTDVTILQDVVTQILQLGEQRQSAYVCLSNVHMCMEVFDDPAFREVVNGADIVLPDGKPIAIAQRLLGAKEAKQVRGQDVMNTVCAASTPLQLKVGLYGGSDDKVLALVADKLRELNPGIDIAFMHAPPFRALTPEEDQSIIREINEAGVNLLFVGIGCPKQEIWMAEHKGKLDCVMFGVGAAFDFISGSKKHAPVWMQRACLEWLYRLGAEPRRLGKRYLKQNPRFIYHFSRQWLLSAKYD